MNSNVGADDSSSGQGSPIQVLSRAVTQLLLVDPKYVYCVMNSGLLQYIPKTPETAERVYNDYSGRYNGPSGYSNSDGSGSGMGYDYVGSEAAKEKQQEQTLRLLAASLGIDGKVDVGVCRLACTSKSFSSSCCDAVDVIQSKCQLTASAQAYSNYTEIIEDMFSYKNQCTSVAASTLSLWVLLAVLVVVVTTLVVATRRCLFRAAKQPTQAPGEDDATVEDPVATEVIPSASSNSKWTTLLLSWRQVSNLVWKNLRIKRAKPVAMAMEVLLPMLLTLGLVAVVNLDVIFGGGGGYFEYNESIIQNAIASTPVNPAGYFCTKFDESQMYDASTLGAPSDSKRSFYTNGQTVIGLFLLIVYIRSVSRTTAMMVIEKESRLREIMKIMGLSDRAVVLSWVLTTAVFATPLSFGMAAMLKYADVLPQTSYVVLVWLFFLFSQAITAFSYFLTPFFNKSRAAAIASVLVWIVLYLPYFAVQSSSNATKYAAALSPPSALGLAVDEMLRRAQLGSGLTYDMAVKRSPIKVPSALAMCGMLLLDSVILYVLGWYIDQVMPQEHGVPKSWNFLFMKSYWTPAETKSSSAVTSIPSSPASSTSYVSVVTPSTKQTLVDLEQAQDEEVDEISVVALVEPASAALVSQERHGKCLQIHKLRKEYVTDDSIRVAVDDLSLTMYSGHITALLGHNGAGKTTAISMLTGLTTPTSGDATLFGRSIRTDFDELRQIMGICPQHDVLLADLSVEDHLLMFGTMKGVAPHKLAEEADKMIREVGLVEKRKVQAKNLSGGQKRKLSVALAFIGDSKLVFLDEPTSGMDPYSRRFTWNLLQRNRDDRVIVLTTHFMDEADILGDRIAIMADGQLCCAGSSLFLKNRYGAGYNLTLIKDSAAPLNNLGDVTQFLQQFVAEAKCLSHHGSEMVFQLPTHSVGAFPDMLEALDQEMSRLHITQYGVSVTTLEEVFLRIARDREADLLKRKRVNTLSLHNTTTDTSKSPESIECGQPTFTSQFTALLTKRVRITKRDRKSLLNSIAIPVILLLIAAIIPEIKVSSFFPDYSESLPTDSSIATCALTRNSTSRDAQYYINVPTGCEADYNYCSLGIFECDASVCCSSANRASPYFPCNNCDNPYNECYNPTCMSDLGAKAQVTLNSFLRATIIALAFAFIPAAIVAFVVREKDPIQNATMLQLICGARPAAYWLANWTHDIVVMMFPVILATVLVPLMTRSLPSIQADEVLAIVALLVSHGLAVIPMAYVVSFRYEKHSSAQTMLLVLGVVTGGALSIISFLCRMIDVEITHNKPPYDPKFVPLLLSTLDRSYLRWIYMLFPAYALNNGMYEIAMHRVSHRSLLNEDAIMPPTFFGAFPWLGGADCTTECWDQAVEGCCVRSVFALDVAGAPILYGLLEAALFTVLLWWLGKARVSWKKSASSSKASGLKEGEETEEEEDSDVAAERARLQFADPSDKNSAVFMRNLRQQYKGGKVALDDLSLAIPKGECFGYLGINGAGKSTTMKILTGQIAPSSGFASLGGYDLSQFRDEARTLLGYCPQFDSLHDLLTVEEQLELYARLKGIPSNQVREAVDQKIREVGLEEYRSKLTRGLSGGNKRKVSTAIALMGAPRIIFLDEPSTGVDPSSRRKMWDVIASVCAEKESCVVLTTHSMEECEALATRVGILVGGKLMCLGSVEHLKQKFGTGFTVEVKLQEPAELTVSDMVERVSGKVELMDGKVTTATLERVCEALGDVSRSGAITEGEARALVLTQLLESDEFIPLSTLCEWWVSEDLSANVAVFFASRLPGSELVEQKASDHFRFQVPKHALQPSAIFRLLEDAKEELHVAEYSVSDTSLEHIFNTMAAQQSEEVLMNDDVFDPKAKVKKSKKSKTKKAKKAKK